MDIFDPTTGEVRSSGGSDLKNDVAAWFIDDDYNEESFFVRQAYFVGQDPYESLKRALKAEIDENRLGGDEFNHLPPVSKASFRPHLRQGHQPFRRRGAEGFSGLIEKCGARQCSLAGTGRGALSSEVRNPCPGSRRPGSPRGIASPLFRTIASGKSKPLLRCLRHVPTDRLPQIAAASDGAVRSRAIVHCGSALTQESRGKRINGLEGRRNLLKRPDSDKEMQQNPSLFL